MLAASIRQNESDLLERYLVGVAGQRMAEGYVMAELHAIITFTEQHLQALVARSVPTKWNATACWRSSMR